MGHPNRLKPVVDRAVFRCTKLSLRLSISNPKSTSARLASNYETAHSSHGERREGVVNLV
jgi:hypothetical protein